MIPALITTILNSAPGIISAIKSKHAADNPGAPPLTDEQVFAGLYDWVTSTVAKDDALSADIRKRHPDIGSDVPGGGAI